MTSIGEELDRRGGLGPGFDRLRLVLASLVIVVHSFRIEGNFVDSPGGQWLAAEMIVPMFFVLSGFLVAGSAHRHSARRFVVNRFLRIYPAFAVCLGLSALVMGPLVTTLPLRQYFTSKVFLAYFLMLFGREYYWLPGVFKANPDAGFVNVSLWTVRWEIGCYAVVGAMAALGLLRRKRLMLALGLLVILLPSAVFLSVHAAIAFAGSHIGAWADRLIAPHEQFFVDMVPTRTSTPSGGLYWLLEVIAGWNFKIVPFFFAGVLAYLFRYRIPFSSPLALAFALGLLVAGSSLPERWNGPLIYLMASAPAVYLVAWAGLINWHRVPRLSAGDYSYGVYLYGYPIQQLIVLSGWDQRQWWLNSLISLPLAVIAAAVSWHLVEYPILRRRSLAARRFGTTGRSSVAGLAVTPPPELPS